MNSEEYRKTAIARYESKLPFYDAKTSEEMRQAIANKGFEIWLYELEIHLAKRSKSRV